MLDLNSLVIDGVPTLTHTVLFSVYPQAFFPNLCIHAVLVPGFSMGDTTNSGERFLANNKIEGTLEEQVESAIDFVKKNMSVKTSFNESAKRVDTPEYPLKAVREAVLNAVIHRDYSIHTENQPIQVLMFKDRIEIKSPGGLFGRMKVKELGSAKPDTRNPNIVKALEILGVTENRYSGIPTIKKEMQNYGLPQPKFIEDRGDFTTILFNASHDQYAGLGIQEKILLFCRTPRKLDEISDFLNMASHQYIRNSFLNDLVDNGLLRLTIPNVKKSKHQQYVSI